MIAKIFESTTIKLPENQRSIDIFLFSEQAKYVISGFYERVGKLYSSANGIFVAPLEQSEVNALEQKIREMRESFQIDREAKIFAYLIVYGNEEVLDIDFKSANNRQVVRLINKDVTYDEIQDGNLYTFDTESGLDALILFSCLQGLKGANTVVNKGIIKDALLGSSVREEWVRSLCDRLYAEVYTTRLSDERIDELKNKAISGLYAQLQGFLKGIQPFPHLSYFPIDEAGFGEIYQPETGFLQSLKSKFKRKDSFIQIQTQEAMRQLFGTTKFGTSKVLDYYKDLYDNQQTDELFKNIWEAENAWYYSIPIQWLSDNLVSMLYGLKSISENELEGLIKKSENIDTLTLSNSTLSEILEALDKWSPLGEIYKKYAEAQFWLRALEDAREGQLHKKLIKAKEQNETDLRILQNFRGARLDNYAEVGDINWGIDKNIALMQKPIPKRWETSSLKDYFAAKGNWWWINSVFPGSKVYCLINCIDSHIIEELKDLSINNSFVKPEWIFSKDFVAEGIALFAVIPKECFQDRLGGK